ncbi:splicing factor 3A subunit 3 [Angomonas deanei]|nr:splicing factor 3A subunit 3 [Angomonas deanei]|eukprot:EPY34552.1 splicing factor 3A subunit 3 [Angomonas deanei]
MESGVLERIRAFEADVERYVDSIVQQEMFQDTITNPRHRILCDHFKLHMTQKVQNTTDKLLDAYLDEDDIVEAQEAPHEGDEVVAMALNEFEKKTAMIREYHHMYRDLPRVKYELELPDEKILDSLFTAPERYGACLDMESHYNRYSLFIIETNTLKSDCSSGTLDDEAVKSLVETYSEGWDNRLEYYQFLSMINTLLTVEVDAFRKLLAFRTYGSLVEELASYLEGFYKRCHPLEPEKIERVKEELKVEMDEFWSLLEKEAPSLVSVGQEESDSLMGDKRKSKQVSCGLVIPPPLRKQAKKFSLWPVHVLDQFIRPDGAGYDNLPKSVEEVKQVCLAEATIFALLQTILFDSLKQTEVTFLRDYSKTVEEVEMDRARGEKEFQDSLKAVRDHCGRSLEGTIELCAKYHLKGAGAEVDEEGDEEAKRKEREEEDKEGAFLGDDNEPVARWLVQLQQLDKKFICEVCGGTVFHGPKAFRDHFGAERHTIGLHHLGVTQNLRRYQGLSGVRAVIQLRDTLEQQSSGLRKRVREDADNEELQDNQGKVFTTKEYKQLHATSARRK